jgi:hypothetical protein
MYHERFSRSRFTGVGVPGTFPVPSWSGRRSSAAVPACAAGRLRDGLGRGEHGRTASVGGHRVCPPASYAVARARFKESLELVSTAHHRAGARPASAARRAAARASFFSLRLSLVCALLRLCAARGPRARSSRRCRHCVRQTYRHSWRWITGFVRR